MNKQELFKVRYIGESSHRFTKGCLYPVIELDEDGDYLVLDDFRDLIVEYKSNFIALDETE